MICIDLKLAAICACVFFATIAIEMPLFAWLMEREFERRNKRGP